MYLTAHRVRESSSNQTAIHVFVHLHGSNELFNANMSDATLIKRVTEKEPGRLVDKELVFSAGGNDVLSYMDVVTPDFTPQREILNALDSFRRRVEAASVSIWEYERYGAVLVSFSLVFGLQGVELREYDNLCKKLKVVMERYYTHTEN